MRNEIYLDGIWAYFADTRNQFKDVTAGVRARLGDIVASRRGKCIVPSVTNLLDKALFGSSGRCSTRFLQDPAGARDHLVSLKFGG